MRAEQRRPRRAFHQAAWDEDLILRQGRPGARAQLLPEPGARVRETAGDVVAGLPEALRRTSPPDLPELSQPEVLRHYTRLSQMVMANNVSLDLGIGTCTMKYNPPVHEQLARGLAELHPSQPDATVQGILEVLWRFEQCLKSISGMDRFSFQPSGGAQGVFTNALIIKAYHEARGEADTRDEIITTVHSHPADGGAPATVGFKVITLYPDERGYPDIDALRAAVSDRTAGLMITNPEDTGLYNPRIAEFVQIVHDAGGLCHYDQANANGILGIARARDAGFDLCQFNLHKTFATPHACMGLACGPVGVTEELAGFLPSPRVEFDGARYVLDPGPSTSIGTVRAFLGNPQTVLRAYAWVMSLGAAGLREVATAAVLNNNYLAARLSAVPGLGIAYEGVNDVPRLEQIRYTWEKLAEETGVGTVDVHNRMADFGLQSYWMSHHPWLVPEPFTLEPSETFSKEDLDEYAEIFAEIATEAYADPETVRTAPHRSSIGQLREEHPTVRAATWRAARRKLGLAGPAAAG